MPLVLRISHTADAATLAPRPASSPWILRYPHAGFSWASRRTRALMFRRVAGRPVLPRMDLAAQCRRAISRCQRRIVSGVTSSRSPWRCAFGITPSRVASSARSAQFSLGRRGCCRCSMASWWRRIKISAVFHAVREHRECLRALGDQLVVAAVALGPAVHQDALDEDLVRGGVGLEQAHHLGGEVGQVERVGVALFRLRPGGDRRATSGRDVRSHHRRAAGPGGDLQASCAATSRQRASR